MIAGAGLAALAANAPRGLVAMPRAEANDPKALVAQLNNAFEEFKAAQDEKLASKADDVVLNEKVDRLNNAMSDIEAALNEKIAAAQTVSPQGDMKPTDPEYLNAFKAHMRKGDVQAAMTVGTDADGGYLAPVEWDRTVTNALKQRSPIRDNAQVITISGTGFSRVYNDGVVGSGWVGETAARPETSTPGLSTLNFETGELYANPAISQKALDDVAIDLEGWIRDEVSGEFAIQENIAFLSGNGTNKPFGILTYVTGATNAAKHPFGAIEAVDGTGTSLTDSDDLLNVIYDLPSERNGNAKWYMNRTTLGVIRSLKDGDGNYLWQPSYQADQPSSLAGYSVIEVPGMPDIGASAVPALFGDMAMTYLVVDRVGLRVLRDPFTNKPFVHFYTTKRVGGGVQNPEYMRALKMAAS
jgi:HK97 family phage major capsid protein|tara:strand:+ start:3231 stop:4469 length:1239 start_codon:yes stop_codon:yes gene_type:complete